LNDAAMFAEEEVLRGVTENIMMGQLARVGTGDMDLLLDEQKVVRDAVEVVVDGFEGDKDLGLAGGIGMPTPYASTPFASSPSMNGGSVEMSPYADAAGGFSPAVGGFSPSYSPRSGSYNSASGSYGRGDFSSASPVSISAKVDFFDLRLYKRRFCSYQLLSLCSTGLQPNLASK